MCTHEEKNNRSVDVAVLFDKLRQSLRLATESEAKSARDQFHPQNRCGRHFLSTCTVDIKCYFLPVLEGGLVHAKNLYIDDGRWVSLPSPAQMHIATVDERLFIPFPKKQHLPSSERLRQQKPSYSFDFYAEQLWLRKLNKCLIKLKQWIWPRHGWSFPPMWPSSHLLSLDKDLQPRIKRNIYCIPVLIEFVTPYNIHNSRTAVSMVTEFHWPSR